MSGQRETVMGQLGSKAFLLGYLLVGSLCSAAVIAETQTNGQVNSDAESVVVGITGHYRVGRWTSVRVNPACFSGKVPASTSIETIDGDGVRVRYEQKLSAESHFRAYAIPGNEAAPIVVREGESDRPILSTRFPAFDSPSRGPSMVPLGMPWIVAIGDPMGIQNLGANDLLKRDATVAVSQPTGVQDFPSASLGYDGVDLMVISGSGLVLLQQLDAEQQAAITDWIISGGRVFLTMGSSTAAWIERAPWLLKVLPLDLDELSAVTIDPSALETYTSTRVPLAEFQGVRLPRATGKHFVVGRTTRRVSTPLASNYAVGFGQVTVMAADLDQAPFAAWPDRLGLIIQLNGSLLAQQDSQAFPANRATAFDDLAGQTRSTLDQFTIKRKVGFSIISLMLLALLAAIGPLDYLLVNRWLGKPLLGWLTFPLMAVGLSAVLVYQAQAKPSMQSDVSSIASADTKQAGGDSNQSVPGCTVNRLEIVDIDGTTHAGRVFSWNMVYSHPANRFDVNVMPSSTLRQLGEQTDSLITHTYGYPGMAFGGIQIAGEDLRMPGYRVVMSNGHSDDPQVVSAEFHAATVKGLPLAPRSSKSLATSIRFRADSIKPVQIHRRAGSELLAGEFVNPLPVDLLDGMLVYQNWTYLLPTRFPGGSSIPSVDNLRQKNFRWQLSRKKALESSSEGEAWNPADFDSITRVAEMLMFHDAVGGTRYTGLKHDPLASLDLSHVLTDDRCVLVGRLATAATRLGLSNEWIADLSPEGESLTMIRLVLPVDQPKSR